MADDEKLVTKSGHVLTDADIEALADEAEAGYEVIVGEDGKARLGRAIKPAKLSWEE